MKQIIKYLLFVVFLAAATFAAANFDVTALFGSKASRSTVKKDSFSGVYISKKPSALLTGLAGPGGIDYSSLHNLTSAAADDVVMIWQLPDAAPLREIDAGDGFQVLSLRFIPATSLVAVGGTKPDNSGSIMVFDAATGVQRLLVDEPEPILFLDPHPGGKYLLATGDTYIKVIDLKDGNTVAIIQKSNPASRAYYYDNGQYVLQSDSLSLFDLKKRSAAGALDAAAPLLFKKGLDGATFAWVTAEGVSVVTSAGQGGKRFYTLDTRNITAFDIEQNGRWGLFLLDNQKLVAMELATGKVFKAIPVTSPASDVTISPDGASAYLQYTSGSIGVYDIGYRNRLKNAQHGLTKIFGTMKNKLGPAAKPEPK